MRPNRLLAPLSAVLFLAALIGCAGDGSSIGGSSGGSTSGDNGGSGSTLVPAGTYATSFTGTNNATPAVSFSGSGTASVASDGTVTVSYTSVSNETPAVTTSRVLTAKPSTTASVTGSLVVGSNAAIPATVSLVQNSNGTYKMTSVSTTSSVTETDVFTLTSNRPSSGTYSGAHTASNATAKINVDNNGATYTGAGSATVASNGTVTLNFTSRRSIGGTVQNFSLSTTLLADGTFSGSLGIGTGGSLPATGAWAVSSGNVLTLSLNYQNTTIADVGYPNLHPTVNETLALTKQ